MPLFSRREPSPEPVYEPETVHNGDQPSRKLSLFHRNREPSPTNSHHTVSSTSSHGGGLRHTNTNANANTNLNNGSGGLFRHSTDSTGRRSLFHRDGSNNLDPSILQARERMMHAESAEIEADRALGEARLRVREAKDHVWRLEEEAKEEARRAKIKQEQALLISKRGKNLGRHGL